MKYFIGICAAVIAAMLQLNAAVPTSSFFNMPQDSEGYTVLSPSSDSRMIFVGAAADVPESVRAQFPSSQIVTVSTVAAGLSQMRAGYPDHLHIKRGSVFNSAIGDIGGLRGRSPTERAVIRAYGNSALARPLFQGAGLTRCISVGNQNSTPRNLVIADMACNGFGETGLFWVGGGSDILLENLAMTGSYQNMAFYVLNVTGRQADPLRNVVIRRSIIANAPVAGRSQGLYMGTEGIGANELILMRNVLIEGNLIYKNGLNSLQAHNMYIGPGIRNMTVENNFSLEPSSHALMLRSGGNLINNFVAKAGIGLQWGSGGANNDGTCCDPTPLEPLTGSVEDNIVMDGRDIGTEPRGFGMAVQWIAGGGNVSRNIFANNATSGNYPHAIQFFKVGTQSASINNVTLEDNLTYNWRSGFELLADVPMSNIRFNNNRFYERNPLGDFRWGLMIASASMPSSIVQGTANLMDTPISSLTDNMPSTLQAQRTGLSFKDPSRRLETYNQSLGGTASYQEFVTKLMAQDKTRFDNRYTAAKLNAYLRDGFGVVSPRDVEDPLPQCPSDLDGDGGVTSDDLVLFLQYFEAGDSRADLDNGSDTGTPDGGVDVSDLVFFMKRFEAGC